MITAVSRRAARTAAIFLSLGLLMAAAPGVGAQPPGATPAPAQTSATPPKPNSLMDLSSVKPIAVVAGAPGTHPLAVAGRGEVGIAPDALAKAQAYSDSLGGHALLIWRRGKIRYEHYGDDVTADTRYETFSMHKSVLGLVYGAALRDGIIHSLDDKAGDYLAEWANDPRGQITLRQLLTMSSGLSQGPIDAKAEVALAAKIDVPPGSRFEYNNANSELAGLILDRALKRAGRGDYAAYLSKALFKPLGMGDAHLWLDHEGGEPRFFAYLQMRARDWLRIGILIDHGGKFDGGQVLPASWIKAATTPSSLNPNYGLQMWIGAPWSRYRAYGPRSPVKMSNVEPYLAKDMVFFDGFGGERVYVSPELDMVIVRIGEPSFAFDDSIIPNDIIRGLQP